MGNLNLHRPRQNGLLELIKFRNPNIEFRNKFEYPKFKWPELLLVLNI
jgi:hypothetical protein